MQEHMHVPVRVTPLWRGHRSSRLVVCSVCLRVREGKAWIAAAEAIRRLRTFEDERLVQLGGGLCDRCETELRLRRRTNVEPLAA
jgi:NMD protein affecting ribosome stability and mRNA decay